MIELSSSRIIYYVWNNSKSRVMTCSINNKWLFDLVLMMDREVRALAKLLLVVLRILDALTIFNSLFWCLRSCSFFLSICFVFVCMFYFCFIVVPSAFLFTLFFYLYWIFLFYSFLYIILSIKLLIWTSTIS